MAGSSDHLEPRGHLPFVCQHRLHPARLADNRTERLLAQARQRSQQMRHAAASRLFVVGECEMNRLPHVHGLKSRKRGQSAGQEALHVGGTAAVKPVAVTAQGEWIRTPLRLPRRNYIHMSGDDVAPTLARADRDKKVGAVAFGTRQNRHLRSGPPTVVADPIDDPAVWRAHDSGKCDQPRENLFHVHGGHSACAIRRIGPA